MRPGSDRLDLAAIAVMMVLCALWGINQVAIKLANGGISPLRQAGLRSAGASVLLWIWSRRRGARLFRRDGTLALGAVAALLFAGEFAFLYWGLEFTNASRAVLFLYTAPIVVAIGAHLFVPGERLRLLQVLGLAAAFAGTGLAFADALRLPTLRELLGDGMALTAGILWGATTVLIKATRLSRISPDKTLFYQLAGSSCVLVLLSYAFGEPGVFAPTQLVFVAFAYQIIVVAFASYLAWFWLIARYPASRLASFSFLTPLFGLIAGAVLLDEPVTKALVLAILLVGLGIYLVNRRPGPAAAAPVSAQARSQFGSPP